MPLNHRNEIRVGDVWEKSYFLDKNGVHVKRFLVLEVHSTHTSAVGMWLNSHNKTTFLVEDIIYHGSQWSLIARV